MKEKKTKDDLEDAVYKAHMAGAIDGFEISKLSVHITFTETITTKKMCQVIRHIQETYDIFAVGAISARTIRVSFLQSYTMPLHSYYITVAPNGCLGNSNTKPAEIDDSGTLNIGTQTTKIQLGIKTKTS